MMLLRRAKFEDLEAIHRLANESGVGLTTLPKDKNILEQRLRCAEQSFDAKHQSFENDYYLFVLEDTLTHTLVGTSAILAAIGGNIAFYSYKRSKQTKTSPSLGISVTHDQLKLIKDRQQHSELCTLFLEKPYRQHHNGPLLSRARMLFIANFPNRFKRTLIAEMRGVSDQTGYSPFWDAIGFPYFHMPFEQASRLYTGSNKQFIADLLPDNPINVDLLPQAVQEAIGKTHPSTKPALHMLLREGFQQTDRVDILDAGPTVMARTKQVKTIRNSKLCRLQETKELIDCRSHLIANTSLDFRCVIAPLYKKKADCILTQETAELLNVTPGDTVRCIELENS